MYDVLAEHTSLLSRSLREQVGIAKRGELDAIISRLQMQGYVVTVDFVYPTGKDGRPYSWGLAQYATPEQHFGEAFTKKVYARKPQAVSYTHLARTGILLIETGMTATREI